VERLLIKFFENNVGIKKKIRKSHSARGVCKKNIVNFQVLPIKDFFLRKKKRYGKVMEFLKIIGSEWVYFNTLLSLFFYVDNAMS
jgi:hypothetical protein